MEVAILSKIKALEETTDKTEVKRLLGDGWMIISVSGNKGVFSYCLGLRKSRAELNAEDRAASAQERKAVEEEFKAHA